MENCVYFVATPIGNLEDITIRALNILKEVDFICCEDTRHSIKLLNHYEIHKPLVAYHKFNEYVMADQIVSRVLSGESCAVISDAGTPLMCDPGNELVRRLIDTGIEFYLIPGANAFIPAMIYSGLPTDAFSFKGFFSDTNKERKKQMEEIMNDIYPTIKYVPPHDLKKILSELKAIDPDRFISISKEITKVHETTISGTVTEVLDGLEGDIKGEFVLVVSGKKEEVKELSNDDIDKLFDELCDKYDNKKEALKELSKITGITKRELYDRFMK